MKVEFVRVLQSVLILSFLFISCGEKAKDPRKELMALGIEFTKESFIEQTRQGYYHAVKLFLAAHMNPNASDENAMTALMWAAYKGYPDIVEALLSAGADVNVQAKSRGRTGFFSELFPSPDHERRLSGATALMLASWKGHAEIVELLLNHGAEVNIKNNFGLTALSSAKVSGNKKIVALLEAKNAK